MTRFKTLLAAALLLSFCSAAFPQGIGGTGIVGDVQPLLNSVGTANPSNCTTGALFFRSDATAGQNIYGCTSANTWTAQVVNLAAPGPIGGTTPAAVTGTLVTATTAFVVPDAVNTATIRSSSSATTGLYMTVAGNLEYRIAGALQWQSKSSGFLLYGSNGNLSFSSSEDAVINRYGPGQLLFSKDGVGLSTNAGWVIGYGGSSGVSKLWNSVSTKGTNDYTLYNDGTNTILNGQTGGDVYLSVNGTTRVTVGNNNLQVVGQITSTGVASVGSTGSNNGPLIVGNITDSGYGKMMADNAGSNLYLRGGIGIAALNIVSAQGIVGFTSTLTMGSGGNIPGDADAAFSRLGPASVALGNGTAGSFTGALKLTTLTQASGLTINSGAGAGQIYNTGSAEGWDMRTGFSLASGFNIVWGNQSNGYSNPDTNLSRCAANILCVGTGSAASFAGTLKLTTLTAATTVNVGDNTANLTQGAGPSLSINNTGAWGASLNMRDTTIPFWIIRANGRYGWSAGTTFTETLDTAMSRCAAGIACFGTGAQGAFDGTVKLATLQGGTTLTLNNAASGTLTFGSNAVTPASTGTRYLCISTAGLVASSATACSGT